MFNKFPFRRQSLQDFFYHSFYFVQLVVWENVLNYFYFSLFAPPCGGGGGGGGGSSRGNRSRRSCTSIMIMQNSIKKTTLDTFGDRPYLVKCKINICGSGSRSLRSRHCFVNNKTEKVSVKQQKSKTDRVRLDLHEWLVSGGFGFFKYHFSAFVSLLKWERKVQSIQLQSKLKTNQLVGVS